MKKKKELNLDKRIEWLKKSLIEEEKDRILSIEYILERAKLEFKEFIKRLDKNK